MKKFMKKLFREPLFYLLPLLAVLYFIIISPRMEILDVKITRGGKTENIKFPYSVEMAENEVFLISYNLLIKDKKTAKFNVIPDDCIQEILINGKIFPLDGVDGLCNYLTGAYIDFSKYVKEGLNKFEIRILNYNGAGGFRVEVPYSTFKSITLVQYVFVALFLVFIIFILRKLHNVTLNQETVYACVFVFPFVLYAFFEFCLRINYELSGIYQVWDAPIYYAVGRGIVNGIAPWGGLFDIKPPGIFLVSAISFKFFDSPVFTYYAQVFVLILTAAIPIAAYFLLSNYRSTLKFALSMLAGLLLALYSAERSGEFQVESFGAAFACVAVFAMAMPNFEKRKILWTSIVVIGMLGACGFKEPFLFPLFGISLIFCKDIKDWFFRFVSPLAIAVALGFAILGVCGWLPDFLHYLEFMFSTRQDSSFSRALEFHRIYDDLNSFSRGFSIALLILLFLPFLKIFQSVRTKTNEEILLTKIVFFLIASFLSSYSVGLGGEFFEHHFVFALPFYMALFLLLLKKWDEGDFSVAKLGLLCVVFLVIGTIDLPYRFERNNRAFANHFHQNFDERTKYLNDNAKNLKEAAAYLDSQMDEFGIDRYVFIGFHAPGTQIYGWTKHSPMGPYFIQPGQWVKLGVIDTLISNLRKTDAVVIGDRTWELQDYYINVVLNEQFTKHEIGRFQMYFRKNKTRQ